MVCTLVFALFRREILTFWGSSRLIPTVTRTVAVLFGECETEEVQVLHQVLLATAIHQVRYTA